MNTKDRYHLALNSLKSIKNDELDITILLKDCDPDEMKELAAELGCKICPPFDQGYSIPFYSMYLEDYNIVIQSVQYKKVENVEYELA